MIFYLHVLTPTGPVLEKTVEQTVFYTSVGEVTILAHHAPYIFQLQPGFITFTSPEKNLREKLFTMGGVAFMRPENTLFIYTSWVQPEVSKTFLDEKITFYTEKAGLEHGKEKLDLLDTCIALERARNLLLGL